MKKWMIVTGLLAALSLAAAPAMAQKALDKAAKGVDKAADKAKSETASAKDKADKAQKDNKAKGKEKGCNCAQESKASFQQCLAGTKKLKGKARKDAVKKCVDTRKAGIEACQKTCKATGDAGDSAQCSADCNTAKEEAVEVCKSTFSVESCGRDTSCQTETQASQNSCVADVEASNTQCLAGCK